MKLSKYKLLFFISCTILAYLMVPNCKSQSVGKNTFVWVRDRDVSTLDPASFNDWMVSRTLVCPLLDFEGESFMLVPKLASQLPSISEDGKRYLFKLRQGILFSNGREIEASDVKYGLERVLNPKTKSPAANFYMNILGAREFWNGTANEVKGIKAIDKYSLKINLLNKNPVFIYYLTWNMASPLPKKELEQGGEQISISSISSGPFVLKQWIRGQRLIFERNPNYCQPGKPFIDHLHVEIVSNEKLALLRVMRGMADVVQVTLSSLPQLAGSPQWSKNLKKISNFNVIFLSINTQMEPFQNKKIRHAVNMAIDKDKLVRLSGGMHRKLSGIYPPSLPGFNPRVKIYAFNPGKAKKILNECGYSGGFKTELYTINEEPYSRFAQAIQQDLSAVGIHANIRLLASATFRSAVVTPNTTPLVLWFIVPGCPDPDAIISERLTCFAARGGYNSAFYCDNEVEALVVIAQAMPIGEKRYQAFQEIQEKIMADAPWVPLLNPRLFYLHSTQVTSMPIHPIHGFVFQDIRKEEARDPGPVTKLRNSRVINPKIGTKERD